MTYSVENNKHYLMGAAANPVMATHQPYTAGEWLVIKPSAKTWQDIQKIQDFANVKSKQTGPLGPLATLKAKIDAILGKSTKVKFQLFEKWEGTKHTQDNEQGSLMRS